MIPPPHMFLQAPPGVTPEHSGRSKPQAWQTIANNNHFCTMKLSLGASQTRLPQPYASHGLSHLNVEWLMQSFSSSICQVPQLPPLSNACCSQDQPSTIPPLCLMEALFLPITYQLIGTVCPGIRVPCRGESKYCGTVFFLRSPCNMAVSLVSGGRELPPSFCIFLLAKKSSNQRNPLAILWP